MTAVLAARAPGKVNLCLFLGPIRDDGRHELVSVVQSVSLADELVIEPAPPEAPADLVECPGVEGPNLAASALTEFRARTGWDAPPLRLRIGKKVPVAAGMGGGSADAAAALRLAAALAGIDDEALLMELATGLGADVPSQVRPGRVLIQGAGERVSRLPDGDPRSMGILVVPSRHVLSTAAVYAEADGLDLPRDPTRLEAARAQVRAELAQNANLTGTLGVNELARAAVSLCPDIDLALADIRAAGADVAMVSGSGPTVVGLFTGEGGAGVAREAADALRPRWPDAVAATPVEEGFGDPYPVPG